jgi:hypothetical protein
MSHSYIIIKLDRIAKANNKLFSLGNITFAIAKPLEDILCLWVLIPIILPGCNFILLIR